MNLYETLGLEPEATPEEIKAAGRAKVKATHPDRPGGSADAFNKVQRALVVLRDPQKRAKYDETGDEGDQPEGSLEAEAMSLLAQQFHVIVTQAHDIKYVDIVANMRRALAAASAHEKGQIAEIKVMIARFKEIRRRLSRTDGKRNRLADLARNQEDSMREALRKTQRNIEVQQMASDMAKAYVYETDQAPPGANMGQPLNRGGFSKLFV